MKIDVSKFKTVLNQDQVSSPITDTGTSNISIGSTTEPISDTSIKPDSNPSGWDCSTTDIPDLLKTVPVTTFDIWTKKKRTKLYEELMLNEAQQSFENIFKKIIRNQKELKNINYYTHTGAKSENIIFTFKRQTNLEIVFSLDKSDNGIYTKFRVIVNLMPFSEFKYQPIDTKIFEKKFKTGDLNEVKRTIQEAFEILKHIHEEIAQISKHLIIAKSIGDELNKYFQHTTL